MKPLPILLIHGFNSGPQIWYDSGFAQALVEAGDLNPDLVRAFFYGEAADGTYDNRGDVAELSARLAAAIRQLAADAEDAGGPARVILIGHSLGGLLARYYLSCREADEFGTRYAGDVSQLITLGTPHSGVPLSESADLLPADSWLWKVISAIEKLPFLAPHPASEVAQWQAQLQFEQQLAREEAFGPAPGETPPPGPQAPGIAAVSLQESEALRQIQPDSPIIARINAPGAMPTDVRYHLIYGDVSLLLELVWWGRRLLRRILSLGDGAVPAASASHLPNAPFTRYEVPFERQLRLELGRARDPDVAAGVGDLLPFAFHTRLYADAAVQEDVVRQLSAP